MPPSSVSLVGGYSIFDVLGQGVLGTLHRGVPTDDAAQREQVAIWLPTPGLFDPGTFLACRRPRGASQLQDPVLVDRLDAGEEAGQPFAVYDLETSRDLATLISPSSVAPPLALLPGLIVLEQLARGLAFVHLESENDHPCCHGFVVPELIDVSAECTVRLLGLEVGRHLARMAQNGPLNRAFGDYLSPELVAGEAPAATDDIYALGALLLRLTTGLPPSRARNPTSLFLTDGSALPPALASLIGRSLEPAGQRIATAEPWYIELEGWLRQTERSEGDLDLTPLMGQPPSTSVPSTPVPSEETKPTSEPIVAPTSEPIVAPASEPTMPQPRALPAEIPTRTEGSGEEAPIPERPVAGALVQEEAAARPHRMRWVVLVAAFLALGASAWWFSRGTGSSGSSDSQEIATSGDPLVAEVSQQDPAIPALPEPALPPAAEAAPFPEPSTPESTPTVVPVAEPDPIEERDERNAEVTAPALRVPVTPPPSIAATEPRVAPKSPAATNPEPASTTVPQTRERVPAPPDTLDGGDIAQEPDRTPVSPRSAVVSNQEEPPTSTLPVAPQTVEIAPPDEVADSQEPTAAALAPAEPSEVDGGASTAVSDGSAAVVVKPKLLQLPNPPYPRRARAINKEAVVVLEVLVGVDGRVEDARVLIADKGGFGFDQAALKAARRARFEPGTIGGEPTTTWTKLLVPFRLD